MRTFFRVLSYISAFTLGGYATAAQKSTPVEAYRWVITSLCFVLFLFASSEKSKK